MDGRTKIKSGIKADMVKFKGKVENFTSGVFRRVQSYRSNNSDYVPRLEGSLENHPTSGQCPYCSRVRCLLNPRHDYNKKLLLPRSAENAEPYWIRARYAEKGSLCVSKAEFDSFHFPVFIESWERMLYWWNNFLPRNVKVCLERGNGICIWCYLYNIYNCMCVCVCVN